MPLRTTVNPPRYISYVPHGIDEKKFFPIDELHQQYNDMNTFISNFLKGFTPSFTIFYNSRNIRRKMVSDIILAYKTFCDSLSKEKAKECLLLLHTQPVDENGTDLWAVIDALCPMYKVIFSPQQIIYKELNYFYNLADVTINISSNEGWGLSATESLMAGTMVILNVTGGLQDQLRFVDENEKWIDFNTEFSTNHAGQYKKCGEWGVPVFPSQRAVFGSVPTPYIFDDRCSWEDVSQAIKTIYDISREERKRKGLLGRDWVTSNESCMTSRKMAEGFIRNMNHVFENWKSRKKFELINLKDVDFTPKPSGVMITKKENKNGKISNIRYSLE